MTTVTISNMPLVIRLAKNDLSTTESWLYQARRAFSDCTPRDHARQLLSELEYSP